MDDSPVLNEVTLFGIYSPGLPTSYNVVPHSLLIWLISQKKRSATITVIITMARLARWVTNQLKTSTTCKDIDVILLEVLMSMDCFKGKSTGNHGFYHQI